MSTAATACPATPHARETLCAHRCRCCPAPVLLSQADNVRQSPPGHQEDQRVDGLECGEVEQQDVVRRADEDVPPVQSAKRERNQVAQSR